MRDLNFNPFERPPETNSGGDTPPPPKDQSARVILIALGIVGVVLGLLIFSPISLTGDDDDSLRLSGGVPVVPEGFTVLSILVDDLQKPPGTEGPYLLTVPLLQPLEDDRNLGLYTYQDGRWERLATAALVSNGTQASGEVDDMPENLVVLRLTTSAVNVSGWLPDGAAPDPEGLDAVGTLNPLGFAPRADGSITGTIGGLPAFEGRVVPTVRASEPAHDDAVNTILDVPELRENHVRSLVQLSLQEGYAGIDIDYARVDAASRSDFTAFIEDLAEELHGVNRVLTVTLPMPARVGSDWDAGAYDWGRIASRVDQIKLRADPDPSQYHARVTEVLEHLRRAMDMNKLALVVGRESYERAGGGLRALSLHEALSIASQIELRSDPNVVPGGAVELVARNISQADGASGLHWDDQAFAVAFQFPGEDGPRTVWLENSLSLSFKLDLARRYGVGGIAVTDISDEDGLPDYWEPLVSFGATGDVAPIQVNPLMLTPEWEASEGAARPDSASLAWTAPSQPGVYEIVFILSDGVIRAAQDIFVTVEEPAP